MYMKKYFKCLILILTLLAVQNSKAAHQCEGLFLGQQKPQNQNDFNKENSELKNLVKAKNPSKTIRSSAGHFWRRTKDIIQNLTPSSLSNSQRAVLDKLMSVNGWVIGDLHNGNLSPMRLAVTEKDLLGKIEYAVVDYDDPAPRGPLIFDIIHHIIAAKAVEVPSNTKISKEEIFEAYLRGLKDKDFETPSRINKILAMSPAEFRELEIKKAKKFTDTDGKSLLKDGVRSTQISKSEYQEVLMVLKNTVGHQYEILDIGGREKESGGSADALRYLALLKEKETGDQFLFELKQEATSAVTEFQEQPYYDYSDRLDHYVHMNYPRDIRFQSLVIQVAGKSVRMTLRPKPLYFFDYANDGSKNSAYKEFRDLTMFNAYWLGQKQRLDDSLNAKYLLSTIKAIGVDAVYDSIKALTRELNQFYDDQSRDYRNSQKQ